MTPAELSTCVMVYSYETQVVFKRRGKEPDWPGSRVNSAFFPGKRYAVVDGLCIFTTREKLIWFVRVRAIHGSGCALHTGVASVVIFAVITRLPSFCRVAMC